MSDNNISEVFKTAYNNFDSRPLAGETLRKFYIDDFTKDQVKSIKKNIKISEKFCKMLVIGHRGCGKSTILNKVAEELNNDFHMVSFSAAETLNMNDVETIDILISIYLQVLDSLQPLSIINEDKINGGLLRDLIQFMQDACAEALIIAEEVINEKGLINDSKVIDKEVAEVVINETVNDYYRLFDFPNYADEVQKIASDLQREKLENEKLIYLLQNLFILEYRFESKLWYNAHPCLKRVLRDDQV